LSEAVAGLWDEDRTTWWESLRRTAEDGTPRPSGPAGPRWLRVWEASRPLTRPARARVWR
jgi:1-acyl-sn-glycerol-3-phosphate acyltransferase